MGEKSWHWLTLADLPAGDCRNESNNKDCRNETHYDANEHCRY
jgi:hypothetical protein